MGASCANDACSSNAAIAKCTASTATECYRYLFVYDTTTMTQHGCTSSGFTLTVPRSYGPTTTSTPSAVILTVTVSASPASTSGESSEGAGAEKKQTLGPIVGGTIGACTIISIVALTAFLIHRRRIKAHSSPTVPPVTQYQHNSPQFDPNGFQNGWSEQDIKTWQQSGGVYRPGMPHMGVSEVHGEDRAVEIEASEKTKVGSWHGTRNGAVEVEAPMREEKKWSWRGPVEAPS